MDRAELYSIGHLQDITKMPTQPTPIFTRVPVPLKYPEMQSVVSDIYNKIAQVQGGVAKTAASIPTTQTITEIVQSASASSSGSSSSASITDAIIPVVLVSPNLTTTDQNGNPIFKKDGAVVSWNVGGSDTGVVYQYSAASGVWAYFSGMIARTQSGLSGLAGQLGSSDAGLLVDVTDFAHILKWSGSAWEYADPSDPAGRVEAFLVDPSPTTGWHLCDGTAGVSYLKSDGTTGTQTLPDLVSVAGDAAYMKLGSPASATPNAAVAPAFTGTPQTFTTQAATATGTVNAFVSPNPYTPAGTIDTTGEPRNVVLRPWFRV